MKTNSIPKQHPKCRSKSPNAESISWSDLLFHSILPACLLSFPLSLLSYYPKEKFTRYCSSCVQHLLTFTSSFLCIISRRAIRDTVVPQQQVLGILAPQADAPGVVEISCTLLAQRMAIWKGKGTWRRHR